MSTYCRYCLWIISFFVLVAPVWSQVRDVIYDVASPNSFGLIQRFAYLEDPSKTASLGDVQTRMGWKFGLDQLRNLGFSNSAWWLSFELRNSSAHARHVVIDLGTPLQDYVDWYVVDAGTDQLRLTALSGDRRKFDFSYQDHYTLSLPLTIQPGEHIRVMLRIASHDGFIEAMPLKLVAAEEFLAEKSREVLYLGIYFGCLLAFCLLGLFLFFLTRERIYLSFSAFLLLTIITNVSYYGISAEVIFRNHPDWNNVMLLISFSAGAGMFFLFSKKFLQLADHAGKVPISLFKVTTVLLLLLSPLPLYCAYSLAYRLVAYLILTNIALLSFFAMRMAWRRNIQGLYFCIAFLPLGLALSLKLLSLINSVDAQFLLEKNFFLAQTSLFAVVALGFSIEHSMKTLRTAISQARTHQLESALALKESELKIFHLARVTTAGEITGAVIHELTQPLSSILINSQVGESMIKRAVLDWDIYAALMQDIICQAKMASGVVDRVRQLVASTPNAVASVRVSEIMAASQTLLRYEIGQRDIALLQECPPELQVRGDAIQLQQVIVNLLLNSIHAVSGLPVDRRIIKLSARRSGHTHAVVSVADSGIGFASENRAMIFSAFFTTKESGLGLGLNICRKIVAAHGGDISARSRVPFGSVVEFTVPLDEQH